MEEKTRKERLRREVEEQRIQENLNNSFQELNKQYEIKKENNLQKLFKTDEKFKEYKKLPAYDSLVSKKTLNNVDNYEELNKYVEEYKNIYKKHTEKVKYINTIPLIDIRVTKFKEEEQKLTEDIKDYYNNLYKKY